MASAINPTNIDGAFPVAGQDNDSQGFRNNFTNIRNNLTIAKNEIEALQNKFRPVPTSSIGAIGDKPGMIAIGTTYAYFCYADYDSTNNIWARVPLDTSSF